MANALQAGGWLAFAVHEGGERRHLDEWFGQPVSVDFTFHRRGDVLAAVATSGLVEVEWYLRSPASPTEAQHERLYVLGRRPISP